MDNAANAIQPHDVRVQEVTRLALGGNPVRYTTVTFYVGTHGPFNVEWLTQDFTAAKAKEAIEAKARELRDLAGKFPS